MITLTTDAARRMIRVQISGFLEPEDVIRFAREEQAAAAAMGYGSGGYVLLVDSSDSLIQSQAVVEAFQRMIVGTPIKARRIAIVRSNTLARAQAQRVAMQRADAVIFADMATAEAWLMEPVEARAATPGARPLRYVG